MFSDTTVFIGTYNFTAGIYTIIAYTTNPNGGTDLNNANDADTVAGIKIFTVPGSPTVYIIN